jgi:putative glycosyltransferase (TIGR04372 family)
MDSAMDLIQHLWKEQKREPLVQFKPEEKEKSILTLEDLGVPKSGWFVSLHVREEANSFSRKSNLSTYIPAIQKIIDCGGYVTRMGKSGMQPFPFESPDFINYAKSAPRSKSMDVFLWSECRFFLGTTSGRLYAAFDFATPVLWTNAVCIGITTISYYNTIQVPKL